MAEEKEIKLTSQQVEQMYAGERQKLQELQERMQAIQNAVMEAQGAIDSIKALQENKQENIMVPLGAGNFIEAKPEELKKVKTSIGPNIIIEKTPEETLKVLEKQIQDAKKQAESLSAETQQTAQNIAGLENIMREAAKKIAEQRR